MARGQEGKADIALPTFSDVGLFRDFKHIFDRDAEVTNGAFNSCVQAVGQHRGSPFFNRLKSLSRGA
jgi:hypothetical protein